jgi:hypothetical protein
MTSLRSRFFASCRNDNLIFVILSEIKRPSAWLQKSKKVRVENVETIHELPEHITLPITYSKDFNPENILPKINKLCRFIIQGIII